MSMTLGEEPIRLRFNYIAKLSMKEARSIRQVRAAVQSLTTSENEFQEAREGYSPIVIKQERASHSYTRVILKNLVSIVYRRVITGEYRNELRSIQIFWVYPDFIVFNGRKDTVQRAVSSFMYYMKEKDFELTLESPKFDWIYFTHLFGLRQTRKLWERTHSVYDTDYSKKKKPSIDIAKGVELRAIHDASSEWEVESTQAKKVIAKDAGDSTEDLPTLVSLLGGRRLKAVLLSVMMEEESRYVRLSQGGRIYILKKQRSESRKRRKEADSELSRLLWAIEFAQRINNAYADWYQLMEKRVPPNKVYEDIDTELRLKIQPVLTNGCTNRIAELDQERKRIREIRLNPRRKSIQ